MNAVLRLAEIYLLLCNAGCMLFYNFKATFMCSVEVDDGQNVFFQFEKDTKITEHVPPIMGFSTDIIKQMNETSLFMEECLQSWNKHVNKERSRHYYLNYFTTEQLVILQRELAKLLDTRELDIRIFPMLYIIGHQYTHNDLLIALKAALNDIDNLREEDSEEQSNEIKEFIQYLKDAGHSTSLGLRALQSGIGVDERAEGAFYSVICFLELFYLSFLLPHLISQFAPLFWSH